MIENIKGHSQVFSCGMNFAFFVSRFWAILSQVWSSSISRATLISSMVLVATGMESRAAILWRRVSMSFERVILRRFFRVGIV